MIVLAIVLLCAVVITALGVAFQDRFQRALALIVSAYRHIKQINAGTEAKPTKPRPHDMTISGDSAIDRNEIKRIEDIAHRKRSTPSHTKRDSR